MTYNQYTPCCLQLQTPNTVYCILSEFSYCPSPAATQLLCTTSTLALGVNLPAHLVIIKGTRRYCGKSEGADAARGDTADGSCSSGYKEYDRSVCLQMVGRAGRPQFDTEGVAVIMTQKQVSAHVAPRDVLSCDALPSM